MLHLQVPCQLSAPPDRAVEANLLNQGETRLHVWRVPAPELNENLRPRQVALRGPATPTSRVLSLSYQPEGSSLGQAYVPLPSLLHTPDV